MPEVKRLSIWTITAHPLDYPDDFVARRHEIFPGYSQPTADIRIARTLGEVRDMLPHGLFCLGRREDDEPQIVESWV